MKYYCRHSGCQHLVSIMFVEHCPDSHSATGTLPSLPGFAGSHHGRWPVRPVCANIQAVGGQRYLGRSCVHCVREAMDDVLVELKAWERGAQGLIFASRLMLARRVARQDRWRDRGAESKGCMPEMDAGS
ncbi:hypothetical protein ESCO_000907 [Escovopsis weberi]|uniref:Uncharacterized protein n=1 Tax=Escovopsis weberi TaxID=150374 RepID=A0A0M9VT76_ESCWE|nr:hypothetical protein ESCO_000907 [Escovopsis weberi]